MPAFNRRYRPLEILGQPALSVGGLLMFAVSLPFIVILPHPALKAIGIVGLIVGAVSITAGYLARDHAHFLFSYISSNFDERAPEEGGGYE